MKSPTSPNHPFVVWGSCYLWLVSMFDILWSLILFFCVGDILVLTGTDMVNAIVLLSGIIMLPTNVHILCSIANGKRISHKSKVVCCPKWLCIMWIIIINSLGVWCCIHKIYLGKRVTVERFNKSMKHYRSVPKYKHFVDNLQWSLKCCGLHSYQDWFVCDWYDRIRDYEWDPNVMRQNGFKRDEKEVADSVPLSCCKSGSCISNYLLELGTRSINTKGCGDLMHRIIVGSMIAHLVMFTSVIVVECWSHSESCSVRWSKAPLKIVAILSIIVQTDRNQDVEKKLQKINVRHIMSVNDNFAASSNSLELNPDDTDYENEDHLRDVQLTDGPSRMAVANRVTIEDEDSQSPKYRKKWEDDDD